MNKRKTIAMFFMLLALGAIFVGTPALATDYIIQWRSYVGGCRTPSGGQGDFNLIRGVSLSECQASCYGSKRPVCTAVEHNTYTRGCEVHTAPIASGTGDRSRGTMCYIAGS